MTERIGLTAEDAAPLLGMGVNTLRDLLKAGEAPGYRVTDDGGKWYVSLDALREWFTRRCMENVGRRPVGVLQVASAERRFGPGRPNPRAKTRAA